MTTSLVRAPKARKAAPRKTGSQAAVNVGKLADTTGPHLVTETRFMQQYRIAAAAHGGGDVAALRNGAGQVELFTVGTDGAVWSFYPDPASDTGYSSVQTGLVASAVAAGVDAGGRVVVFAASNVVLSYVVETGQAGAARWGTVQQATVPMPATATAIAKIYTQEIGGALYVGVLTAFTSASPGPTYAFSFSAWDQAPGVFTWTPTVLSTLNCAWSGTSAATAEFTCLDRAYLGYRVAAGAVTHYPVAAAFHSLSVDTALDTAANNQYFAVLADGNLYHLVGGGQKPFSWAQLTQEMSLLRVRADRDAAGAIHLFTLGSDRVVHHLAPLSGGGWGAPVPIQAGAALMAVAANDAGDVELFLVGSAQGALTHLVRDAETSDWLATAVEVPTSGQVEEFVSYSTDVTVYDAAGAPIPGAAVQVWASAQTELTVNGATYAVDPRTPANLVASAAGTLSITQQTSTLGVATLELRVAQAMPAGQSLAVRQFAGVQDRLAAVSGGDLMQAKDAGGGYLLGDAYRTPETTAALAQAFNRCMQLADSTYAAPDASALPRRARRLGVGACAQGSAAQLSRIRAHPGLPHWQLDFSGGRVAFRELTPDAARLLLLEKQARHPDAALSFGDIFGDIGDFIVGVGEGLLEIVDTVVTAVGDAVHAAITFVVDGVTYLFNTVVELVEQAFDLVEALLARVKVLFERVFEWLGFLFGWSDILRTHAALAYAAEQFLGFLEGGAGGIQALIDGGIATAQGEVAALFDGLVSLVDGGSLGGYVDEKQPDEPAFSSAMANNPVFTAALDNAGAASLVAMPTALSRADGTSPFDALIADFQGLAQTVENLPAFAQALDYMKNLGGSPDQIFQQLLSALLRAVQGIVQAALAGAQAVVDALLQVAGAIAAGVRELFTSRWDIPFVSTFYTWLTDSELTLLDLFALVIAIPSTVLYKVTQGSAPFPDEASVDAFKASFSAATLLARSGLGPKTPTPATEARADAEAAVNAEAAGAAGAGAVILGTAGCFCTWVFGILSAVMDFKPTTGLGIPDPLVKTVSRWALLTEVLGQACSIPWITSTGAPDCTTADGANKVAWIYETLGVALDAGFTLYDEAFPENNDTDWGIGVAFLYGAGHAVTVGIVGAKLSGLGLAARICMLVPELCKPLRLKAVETATEGVSLPVIAALDFFGMAAAGIISLADSLSPAAPGGAVSLPRVPGSVPAAA